MDSSAGVGLAVSVAMVLDLGDVHLLLVDLGDLGNTLAFFFAFEPSFVGAVLFGGVLEDLWGPAACAGLGEDPRGDRRTMMPLWPGEGVLSFFLGVAALLEIAFANRAASSAAFFGETCGCFLVGLPLAGGGLVSEASGDGSRREALFLKHFECVVMFAAQNESESDSIAIPVSDSRFRPYSVNRILC